MAIGIERIAQQEKNQQHWLLIIYGKQGDREVRCECRGGENNAAVKEIARSNFTGLKE